MQQERTKDQAILEKDIAATNQREEALQAYVERVSSLLIDKNLLSISAKFKDATGMDSEQYDETTEEEKFLFNSAVKVLRAMTLSILRQLGDDATRKTSVIRFLIEAEIITKLNLDLSGTNLSNTDLSRANLSNANLSNTDLSYANLFSANLENAVLTDADLSNASLNSAILINVDFTLAHLDGANLSWCDLRQTSLSTSFTTGTIFDYADLRGAFLHDCDLRNATFRGADLTHANLQGADLRGAFLGDAVLICTNLYNAKLTNQELEGAFSPLFEKIVAPLLCNVALSREIKVDSNRDCNSLAGVLEERYSSHFRNVEEAEMYINKKKQFEWNNLNQV